VINQLLHVFTGSIKCKLMVLSFIYWIHSAFHLFDPRLVIVPDTLRSAFRYLLFTASV